MPSNMRQFRQSLERDRRQIRQAMRHAVTATGDQAVREIQRRVPPPAWNPGYPDRAPTGDLRSAFDRSQAQETAGTVGVRVGLSPFAGPVQRIKAFVHEFGKVIRPRMAPFLVFMGKEGELVRAKRVFIRPKHYFRTAYAYMQLVGRSTFERNLRRFWPK